MWVNVWPKPNVWLWQIDSPLIFIKNLWKFAQSCLNSSRIWGLGKWHFSLKWFWKWRNPNPHSPLHLNHSALTLKRDKNSNTFFIAKSIWTKVSLTTIKIFWWRRYLPNSDLRPSYGLLYWFDSYIKLIVQLNWFVFLIFVCQQTNIKDTSG